MAFFFKDPCCENLLYVDPSIRLLSTDYHHEVFCYSRILFNNFIPERGFLTLNRSARVQLGWVTSEGLQKDPFQEELRQLYYGDPLRCSVLHYSQQGQVYAILLNAPATLDRALPDHHRPLYYDLGSGPICPSF